MAPHLPRPADRGRDRPSSWTGSSPDSEWEQLVERPARDVRRPRGGSGTTARSGSDHGNLQALLEPTPTGHRLRLHTLKGNARALMTAGISLVGVAAVTLIAAMVNGLAGSELSTTIMLSLVGSGIFGRGPSRCRGGRGSAAGRWRRWLAVNGEHPAGSGGRRGRIERGSSMFDEGEILGAIEEHSGSTSCAPRSTRVWMLERRSKESPSCTG